VFVSYGLEILVYLLHSVNETRISPTHGNILLVFTCVSTFLATFAQSQGIYKTRIKSRMVVHTHLHQSITQQSSFLVTLLAEFNSKLCIMFFSLP
jgi:hypothetical protein